MAIEKGTKKGQAVKAQFAFSAPNAYEVYLVGDFNDWDTQASPMKKDKKGLWKTAFPLKPGRYEYRFIVDGNWENDPSCSFCVQNDFGSMNCIRMVE